MCLFLLSGTAHTQSTELFISEYIEGSSNNKAIEIFNPGSSAVDLGAAGYNIQMHFNGNPAAGLTINLTGTVAPNDVYVLAHSSLDPAILPLADQTNGAGWFNGDDAVVLRRGTTIIDVIGQIGFDPGTEWGTGLTSTADNTLRRKSSVFAGDPDGANAFDPSVEWDGFASNTFDGLGSHGGVVEPPPPAPVLEIHEIQGSGAASPFAGQIVETLDNIVTAKTGSGFFIQAPASRVDADPDTSEGIFVFTGTPPAAINVGDVVDVKATVQEFFNLTELSGSPIVTVDSGGEPLPAPVMLGATLPSPAPPSSLESLEGMLVRVEHAIASAPTDQFGDTAVVATGARPFREPGILFPGLPGLPVWDGNPEIFEINANAALLPDAAFAAGAIIDVAEGPLSFDFGDYQIWPTTLTYDPQLVASRPVRARVAGEMTIGSQNMLRLFDTVNDPGSDVVLTPTVFNNRVAKASLYIRTVLGSPDVVVLEEVENIGVANAVASRLVADDPATGYTAHLLEGNDVGGIDIALLVRSTVHVESVEQLGKDATYTFNGTTALLHDRPPLILKGAYTGNGAPFPITVIGIHNRSLNSIDEDPGDGPRVRAKRLEQALAVARYVQNIQAADSTRRVVVVGDFNAFEFTDGYVDVLGVITGNLDPAGALLPGADEVNPDLINQVNTVPAADRYSYVFDGSAQVLDHTLTTASLQPFVRGFEFSRGNADVPGTLHTDPTTPLALSDHDGMVLFVMTDRDADGLADDADACPASVTGPVTVGACTTSVPDQILSNGCSITDTLANFAAASSNHGGFVSEATQWLTALRQSGAIDNKQRGEIVSCVARSK